MQLYHQSSSKLHARMHHDVAIDVIMVVIVMLTLCYSMMSHVTIVTHVYHTFMFTLHNSLISRALWLPEP